MNAFTTEAIVLQRRPPAMVARMVSLAICAIALSALAYACLAKIDIVVTAQGRVIPSGKTKIVQPLEAGVVRAISVRDGQKVKAGDVLVELDTTTTVADRDRLQRELWEAQADVARVMATLAGRRTLALDADLPPEIGRNQQAMLSSRIAEHDARAASLQADVTRRQAERDTVGASIAQLRVGLPLVRKKYAMREDLARTGHITEAGLIDSRLELLNLERDLALQENRLKEADASLHAARRQLAQAESEFRARTQAELMEVTKRRESASQELIKASQRRELQILRAPIDGVVQQLSVSTIGGVVTQAQALLAIVPEQAPLEVEAQVLNRDIGHVKVGQRVINKVETFDFTRYGYIEGTVLWVGTDAVNDPRLGPVYPIRVKLAEAETPSAVNGRKGAVTAGMNVTADLRTDERRLIEYFLAPLLRSSQEALRER
jgi:hemolysin D